MKKRSIISQILILTITLFSCANFTDGAEKSKKDEPEFVTLMEGEGSFAGTIYDDKNIIPVHEISFTGHSKIGGIRRETDDSVSILDLSKLKEIEILQESYVSPRYQDKEFMLVKTVSNNGAITNDLLVPRNIVICAIATETDMEKSWYMKKIQKIVIESDLQKARAKAFNEKLEEDLAKEEKESFFGKIKKGFQGASNAIEVK